jgi:hypothetical protein
VNNVENVFIANPIPGQWIIRVSAERVVADAYGPTPGVRDVDFALVVSLAPPGCSDTSVSMFCESCSQDAQCCDADACTFNICDAGECQYAPNRYGNVNGDPNNIVNLDDLLCVLAGFSSFALCPNADIAPPCTGDGVINLDDILRELAAFGGANPCGCV